MTYRLSILPRAQRESERLPTGTYGDYRVIYEIEDSPAEVTILHVGHRRDVYR